MTISFTKPLHILHRKTRQHIRAVKVGYGCFQWRERQGREELRRTELQPPILLDSDEDSDTERWWCDVAATSSSEWKTNRRKMRAARPFTPFYRSLISTLPRLLPRDPGRSRTTIKRLNKEKAIEAKWEQFIAPPKARHLTSKPFRVSSGSHLTWKTSTLSVLSSSVTGSSVGRLSSLAMAPEHTCDESVYTKGIETLSVQESDSDSSSSEYLQTFLQELYLSVFKTCNSDNQLTSAPDSNTVKVHPEVKQSTDGEKTESRSPTRQTSATIQLVREKKAEEVITTSFVDKAEELTLNLSDDLDRCAKNRWDFGVQRYQSLCKMVSDGRIPSAVTSITFMASPSARLKNP